mmetsp:Transcript_13843/g.31431  ORF Transcript_13843/g.31431 Transcript_13843/m.31431 type:complete len:706 (+) Transcript_13843:95-2212(+)
MAMQQSHCEWRRREGGCGCVKAQLVQDCQSCKNRIFRKDCIQKQAAGWCHKECPNEAKRGLPAIKSNYNSVDYSLVHRLEHGQSPQSPPRLLPDAATDWTTISKAASIVTPESPTKRPRLAADNPESAMETSTTMCRRALDFSSAKDGTDRARRASGVRETEEQQDILSYNAGLGEVVAINALAGCGKTTTIALLCNKLHTQNKKLLYLVFGKKNSDEAKQSNKFPKENMDIRTTHAYMLRNYFGTDCMKKFNPACRYDLEEIIDTCDLQSEIIRIFPKLSEKERLRKTSTVASYIRRTIEIFQSSAEKRVERKHVFWRATKFEAKRSEWKRDIKIQRYVGWAQEFFNQVEKACQDLRDHGREPSMSISFDSYLKVAQLEEFHIDADAIVIDEAQDMTPCQASLFWGEKQREDKRVYLFGDCYQQLFRFRGASDSFSKVVDESRHKLKLTGSFRFGKNIARYATAILQVSAKETILGLATKTGTVSKHSESMPTKGTVILCRTNQGVFNYLMDYQPETWYNLDGRQSPLKCVQWTSGLEAFLNKEADSFVYKGEEFRAEAAIQDFADEEGDSELMRYLILLRELRKREQSFDDFLEYVQGSFTRPKKNQALDDYDGVVLATVHKAKGLEFKRVVIYDDFKFHMIRSRGEVQNKIFCDEANILYVATTRARGSSICTLKRSNATPHSWTQTTHVDTNLFLYCKRTI